MEIVKSPEIILIRTVLEKILSIKYLELVVTLYYKGKIVMRYKVSLGTHSWEDKYHSLTS